MQDMIRSLADGSPGVKWAAQRVAIQAITVACLWVLISGAAMAQYVVPGGTSAFTPKAISSQQVAGWAISDPSGTLIANASISNGWAVVFAPYVVYNPTTKTYTITEIQVSAPFTAAIGGSYTVIVDGPPNTANETSFNVGAVGNTIAPGATGTFPPTTTNTQNVPGWAIYGPSGSLVAENGPSPDGWNVVFTPYVVYNPATNTYTITDIQVSVPGNATPGIGYSVVVQGPPGNNVMYFNVFTAAPAVDALTISPASIYGGDEAIATVSLGAIAPAGGTAVSVTSNSIYAEVSSVTVPAGRSTASFGVPTTTVPGLGSATATITASVAGATKSASITISSSPSSDGSVRVGQSATFIPAAIRINEGVWVIYSPTGTIIASSGGPAPSNGWSVSFQTFTFGLDTTVSSITVTAPAGAATGSGYSVAVAGPPGPNVAYFTVTH